MSEDESGELLVKEFDERTLGAARLHHLLLRETGIEDPWHTIVLAICAFDKLHLKDGWEFVLMHKRDIEEVGLALRAIQLPRGVQGWAPRAERAGPDGAVGEAESRPVGGAHG